MAYFLRGNACPLLFDKWKPNEFYHDSGKGGYQSYTFDFATVTVLFSPVNENPELSQDIFEISGEVLMHPIQFDFAKMFDPRFTEIYKDAKDFVAKKAGIDVNKISTFRRNRSFDVNVGGSYRALKDIFNPVLDVKEAVPKTKAAHELYMDIEDLLRRRFGIVSECMKEKPPLSDQDTKRLDLGQGVFVEASTNELESVARYPATAGQLSFTIGSDETAKMERFSEVYKACIDYLLKNKDRLSFMRDAPGILEGVISLSILSSTHWELNLAKAELPPGFKLLESPETFK